MQKKGEEKYPRQPLQLSANTNLKGRRMEIKYTRRKFLEITTSS